MKNIYVYIFLLLRSKSALSIGVLLIMLRHCLDISSFAPPNNTDDITIFIIQSILIFLSR